MRIGFPKMISIIVSMLISLTIVESSLRFQATKTVLDLSNHENRYADFEAELFNIDRLQKENEMKKHGLKFLDDEDLCLSRPASESSNFYYFLPMMKGRPRSEGESVSFANGCFQENKFKIEKLSLEETVVTLYSANPKYYTCADFYWISTSHIHTLKEVFFHGEHRITLKNLSQDDLDEIKLNGIKIMSFCQGFFTSLHSFYMSLKLYIGGLGKDPGSILPILRPEVPEYMVKANLEFLKTFANFEPKFRGDYGKSILDIDETQIKSGDFIAIYRLDGLDPLIMFGSGSRLGHSAVACWIDGELYILESQDGWYWPKRGIQRNKWKTWVQWAHNADFNVAILPLKDEIRQKFDVEKAQKWFTSGIEGLNYGYHNFLYSWIDTPDDNLPSSIIQSEIFLSVFSILERISKSTATTIMGESLNQRLQTKGLSIPKAAAEAARRNMTFEQLLAMPEIEGWEYSDGKNYVCSCFVAAFWKAGGIFDDLDIEPTEFTPKDIYQLDFYDKDYKDKRPQICQDADPELPYCQVIGKYQVKLNNYSTVKPYAHMNEKCPSVAPDYFRPDDC